MKVSELLTCRKQLSRDIVDSYQICTWFVVSCSLLVVKL